MSPTARTSRKRAGLASHRRPAAARASSPRRRSRREGRPSRTSWLSPSFPTSGRPAAHPAPSSTSPAGASARPSSKAVKMLAQYDLSLRHLHSASADGRRDRARPPLPGGELHPRSHRQARHQGRHPRAVVDPDQGARRAAQRRLQDLRRGHRGRSQELDLRPGRALRRPRHRMLRLRALGLRQRLVRSPSSPPATPTGSTWSTASPPAPARTSSASSTATQRPSSTGSEGLPPGSIRPSAKLGALPGTSRRAT